MPTVPTSRHRLRVQGAPPRISGRWHCAYTPRKKGRGGKWVTVIAGIPEHPDRLKALSKQLKQQCGVGGGVKDLNIEIQGDQRLPCQQKLQALGYVVKLSGG